MSETQTGEGSPSLANHTMNIQSERIAELERENAELKRHDQMGRVELTTLRAEKSELRARVAELEEMESTWILGARRHANAKANNETLRAKVVELEAQKTEWQAGRAEGRREALAILTQADTESFGDKYMFSQALGDTGDYTSAWEVDKLRALFEVDKKESLAERAEGEYYRVLGEMADLESELARVKAERDWVVGAGKTALPYLNFFQNTLGSSLSCDSRSHDGDRDARFAILNLIKALSAPFEPRPIIFTPEDIQTVREALEPFAAMEKAFPHWRDNPGIVASSHGIILDSDNRPKAVTITFGDYANAAKALALLGGTKEGRV